MPNSVAHTWRTRRFRHLQCRCHFAICPHRVEIIRFMMIKWWFRASGRGRSDIWHRWRTTKVVLGWMVGWVVRLFGTNLSDKISNPILCQSPIPHVSNRRQEKSNYSSHHSAQDDFSSSSSMSNIGPSPAASPKSPFNHHESNYLDSVGTDSKMAPTLQVPKSPRTPSMGHRIRHRFIKKTLYVSLVK
jgi:hypothetical protein